MATLPPNNAPALIIDANVTIALAARETGRDVLAAAELGHYSRQGYEWYAPGVIVGETLYVLCQKHQAGLLTTTEYEDATREFEILMQSILPPPQGEASLVRRAQAMAASYGCSRSADGIYLALAEQLSQTRPAVLLTFDKALAHQLPGECQEKLGAGATRPALLLCQAAILSVLTAWASYLGL